jgi:hypothetical protein
MPISHNHDDADDSLDSAKAIELEDQTSLACCSYHCRLRAAILIISSTAADIR